MTPADPLTVLLDRACRGALSPDEGSALRAAVNELRQRAAGSERQYELAMEGWNREADAQDQRTARYRAAWQSARARAHHVRCVLADYRTEADARKQPAEPRTHESHIWEDEDGWHVSCEHYDCPDSSRDVGSEYDAEEWAEQHQAEATSSQAPR